MINLPTLRPACLPSGGRINLRAVGSPGSSVSSRRDRREGRGKSLPASGTRGRGIDGRPSLSNRTSPRTSQSPDTKRSSMSFGDFVAARWDGSGVATRRRARVNNVCRAYHLSQDVNVSYATFVAETVQQGVIPGGFIYRSF